MAQVDVRGIRKTFDSVAALNGIDLSIAHGEFVTLLGASGCGKCIMLRIIAGLEVQTDCEVLIDRHNVYSLRPSARDVSMLFQSYALYPHLSVFDNMAVPLRMRRLNGLQRMPGLRWLLPGTRAKEALIRGDVVCVAELLGMVELLNRKPARLSGGQRQRVAVGRAIVREPKAFLFDEPLSNLDAQLRVHMRAEFVELHRRLGATTIYVTHDQAEAMTMSDRVAVLMEGRLLQVATPTEIYRDPTDIRVAEFVGSPKINVVDTTAAEDGTVRLNGSQWKVDSVARPGSPVKLAFRPESARLTDPHEGNLRGEIEHVAYLGTDAFVHIRSRATPTPLILRASPEDVRARAGAVVGIDVPASRALAFGVDGRRLGRRPT